MNEPNEPVKTCPKHPNAVFYVCLRKRDGREYTKCKACNVEAVSEFRRRQKRELVARAGGKCCKCGYSRCETALDFHHPDPSKKEYTIAHKGITRNIEAVWAEAKQCLLVCSNCHREIHAELETKKRAG